MDEVTQTAFIALGKVLSSQQRIIHVMNAPNPTEQHQM